MGSGTHHAKQPGQVDEKTLPGEREVDLEARHSNWDQRRAPVAAAESAQSIHDRWQAQHNANGSDDGTEELILDVILARFCSRRALLRPRGRPIVVAVALGKSGLSPRRHHCGCLPNAQQQCPALPAPTPASCLQLEISFLYEK